MRKYFLYVFFILGTLSCCKNEVKDETIYSLDNCKIRGALKNIADSCDLIYEKSTQKSFYRLVVQQSEYNDVIVKVTRITPSRWLISRFPPAFYLEQNSNVFLFYTGIELLFNIKNEIASELILDYKKYLYDDVLPDGSQNPKYSIGHYITWEIDLIDNTITIKKNVLDPFRPKVIENVLPKFNDN